MVSFQLPTWTPLMPPWLGCAGRPELFPCSLHWPWGLWWQGKVYYHPLGRKLPVPYSALSNTTVAGELGHHLQPDKDGSLGSPFCLYWPKWGHDLFCGVWLKWEQLLFFLFLGYSSSPLGIEREHGPLLGCLFICTQLFQVADFITSMSGT